MDFLWHKVSEKEKKDIQNQAKQIMEQFSRKLEKVQSKIEAPVGKRDFERKEGEGSKKCEIDRKIMFDNAPHKNKDYIIAEKGQW